MAWVDLVDLGRLEGEVERIGMRMGTVFDFAA